MSAGFESSVHIEMAPVWREFARVNGRRLPNLRDKPFLAPLIIEGKEILHAGCGDERYVLAFARHGATVIGVEGSSTLAAKVKAGAQKLRLENAFGLNADITDLPLQSDLFDLYTSFNVYDKFAPPLRRRILAEAHRVLKPGGVIYLEVPHFWSAWTLRREFRYWFRKVFPPKVSWQRNVGRIRVRRHAEESGFQTVRTHVFDAWSGFEKGLSLDLDRLHGIPNLLRLARPLLHKVASACDERGWGGDRLVYIGRKAVL